MKRIRPYNECTECHNEAKHSIKMPHGIKDTCCEHFIEGGGLCDPRHPDCVFYYQRKKESPHVNE